MDVFDFIKVGPAAREMGVTIKEYLGVFYKRYTQWKEQDQCNFWSAAYSNKMGGYMEGDKFIINSMEGIYVHIRSPEDFFGTDEICDEDKLRYDYPLPLKFPDDEPHKCSLERMIEIFEKMYNYKHISQDVSIKLKGLQRRILSRYDCVIANKFYEFWSYHRTPIGKNYKESDSFIWPKITQLSH